MTIAMILAAALPAVVRDLKRASEFPDSELERRYQEGTIRIHPIGPQGPNGEGILECSEPLVWSVEDDGESENDKITIVKNLIEKGVQAHSLFLLNAIGDSPAVFSREYRYRLSDPVRIGSNWVAKIHTAYYIPTK